MRKPASTILLVLLAAAVALAQDAAPMGTPPTPPPGYAQPQEQNQNQPDPPSRVARLNYIQGSVSFEPAGTQQWVDASPNRPLTTGDNLWTDQNSRGELHVGSTAIRLSGQTGLSILNLNDQVVQIEVPQGSLEMHVREMADQEGYEIDTPNLAMTILRPGEYRVDVDPNGTSSTITLRSGAAEITAAGRAYNANPGQQYVFTGTDDLTYDAHPAPYQDDFDTWSVSRDQLEDRSVSARYVSRDVIGYEDLDRYGVWREDPDYGPVWVPAGVPVGWAPYHYGHWVYVAPWGWTWVEDEPWGFAPFHYGRWALVGGGWAWVPGPMVAVGVRVRPVYAPALVGFVGGGSFGVSLAIGGGVAGVAWFPLGPRDVWVPAYHCSPRYVENVNISNTRVVNVTEVRNVYVNHTTVINNYTYAHNTVAVTAVSRETFVNSAPVARSTMRVNAEAINHPQVMANQRLEPTSRSSFGPQPGAHALPPATLASRPVVTRMAPSSRAVAVGHTQPLVTERSAYRPSTPANGQFDRPAGQPGPAGNNPASGNRTFDSRSRNNGAVTPPPAAVGNNPPNENRGYRPFTPPTHGGTNAEANPNANGNRNYNAPPRPEIQPHPAPQPRPEVQPHPAPQPHPETQPRSTMRPNGNAQPPSQPNGNRPVQEDRRVQTEHNQPAGAQPHENNNRGEKQPPKQEERRNDDQHSR